MHLSGPGVDQASLHHEMQPAARSTTPPGVYLCHLRHPFRMSQVRMCPLWRPQQDSNLRTRLRRPLLYPLSYGGGH
jgi:hypothetical protein